GLPACRPVVAVGVVAQVDEAARLVDRHAVEAHAQQPARAAGTEERVPARVLRDYAAVQARAEVVRPRSRGVGARDDVLARVVVEVAVTHRCVLSVADDSPEHARGGIAPTGACDAPRGLVSSARATPP